MGVSLHAMCCGWLTVPVAFLLGRGEGTIGIPVLSYVIRHPRGLVVFDTGLERGLNPATAEAALPNVAALWAALDHVSAVAELSFDGDVAGRLCALDIDPARVDYLINSHLHFDHCGGNGLLPNARLVIQKREWEAGCTPEHQAKNHYFPYEFDLGHDRLEVDGEHDLFGDGSILCVPTYGHTPGHQSLRVRLDDGEVLITSDACNMRQSLEALALPCAVGIDDAHQMLANLRMFKRLEDSGTLLLFGHDPEQWRFLNGGMPACRITGRAIGEARLAPYA
jgi:N-acyl homoserine lactone hydrolase